MKAALYSLVGLVSAFNHQQPDPNRYVYQREVPQDFPVPPELQDPIANPSNFPERAFEELDPRDVLPPLPTRQEQDEIYRSTVRLMCLGNWFEVSGCTVRLPKKCVLLTQTFHFFSHYRDLNMNPACRQDTCWKSHHRR